MSFTDALRAKLTANEATPQARGHWRSISACLDEDTGEFLNVGVMFTCAGKVEVRMLDSFERIKCLYGNRVDLNDLSHLLYDIEESIIHAGPDLPSGLGHTIRIGEPLFAAGASPELIVDEFFEDVVTLARPHEKQRERGFRYRSNSKVRQTVFEIMQEKMGLDASRVIQESRFLLKMQSGQIEVDVPLLSADAAGTVVSAWYKSHLVVENNLLEASTGLLLVMSNTPRQKASISVLLPSEGSGLSLRDFNKLNDSTHRQLDRLNKSGVDIITANSTDVLANSTIDWWRKTG